MTLAAAPVTLSTCDALVEAAREFIDHTELLRAREEFRDSWAELLLRALIASPSFQTMRHRVKDYEAARAV